MPVKIEQYQTAIVNANTVEERMRLEEELTLYLSGLQESGMFSEEVLDAKITEVHNAPKESSIYEYIIYEAFFWLVAGAFFVMTGRITLEHNRKIIDRLFKKGHHKDH